MPQKEATSQESVTPPNAAEQRLLDSALTLFAEKGYEGTSIREIIEAAGVTRPVLYYYFVNKEDLFRRLVDTCFDSMGKAFDRIASKDTSASDRLVEMMSAGFAFVGHSPDTIRLILHIFFAPPGQGPKLAKNNLWYSCRFQHIVRVMQDGIDSGDLAPADPETLAWVFTGIMDMHVMTKTNLPEAALKPELAEGLVSLFLAGAGPKGDTAGVVTSPFNLA